ncbi:MAG: redox-regulated ATPase YchF [Chloroflexi bacterium]|nr:redox-regulated ATPase YchF [Chloroflexota bacterium]
MDLGIIGLEFSGKTTIFNAVTRGSAHAGSFGGLEPSIGVVKLPDNRLDRVAELSSPKKITYIETRFLDFPGGLTVRDEGPTAAHLAALAQCDALVHVVRSFENDAAPTERPVDPHADIENVNLEMAFADAATLERRQEKLEANLRLGKADNRDAEQRELELVTRLREGLDREEPLRAQQISAGEAKILGGYVLLTSKPLLLVINVDEADASKAVEIEAEYAQRYASAPGVEVAAMCGKLEQELSELSDEDAIEFRRDIGMEENGVDRMVQAVQRAMGILTFFTIGEPEGRAWPLPSGGTALDAAGQIHSDMSRGFIRAEVIGWDELVDCGSLPAARKRGLLRTEGKQYVVQDGDVMLMLFNV